MPINTDTPNTIANNLSRITDELSTAQADVAFLGRLRGAEALVKSLSHEQASLSSQLDLALAAEAEALRAARFASLGSIRVVDQTPDKHVIGSVFRITYGKISWDMDANISIMTDHIAEGFAGLPSEVLEYLIEEHPSQIPFKIAGLAATPGAAFARYFVGMQRGFLAVATPAAIG